MLNSRYRERGDSLIEVLFAVTVFSFVVVGALTIMNQGTAASQRSLEIGLVRQQIDGQAEALRFMHDSYVAVYQNGLTYNTTDGTTTPAEEWYAMAQTTFPATPSAFGAVGATCPTPPNGSFIIDTQNVRFVRGTTTSLQRSVTYSQVAYNGSGAFTAAQGLWIEPIRSAASGDTNQSNARYIDFHIRACWEAPGLTAPLTTGTIVRLYEPRA